MTLQEASEILNVSKKKLWRAVKAGQLDASRVQRGGRWEYRVSDTQLTTYRSKYLDSLEMRAVGWSSPPAAVERPVPTPSRVVPALEWDQSGLHQALLERLARAERRIAELEQELSEKQESSLKVNQALAIIKEATHRERQLARLADVLEELKANALCETFSSPKQF